MKYYDLKDMKVSNIALGCMRIASKSYKEVEELVLKAVELGVKNIIPVITKNTFDQICSALSKKTNLESAVNYLSQYRSKYMSTIKNGKLVPTVEGEIFDYFANKETRKYYGKKDFHDVLETLRPQALEHLKLKQFTILNSSNNIIQKMSPQVAELVN